MKRIIALLLALLFAFCLFACTKESPKETAAATGQAETPAPTASPGSESEPAQNTESAAETETVPETDGPGKTARDPYDGPISPLMWRVTDEDGHTLYLFGTIHVGDERNETVLGLVSDVLGGCDALAVEFDAVAYEERPDLVLKDMLQYVLKDGGYVSDHMPEDLYRRAYDLVDRADLSPSFYLHYNLAWWSQLIDSAMLTVYTDLDAEYGMDDMLIRFAYGREIPVLDVESAEFQMALSNSFDDELYLLMIEEELDSADTYEDEMNDLYELWLSGDRDAFWTMIAEEDDDVGDLTEEQIAMIEEYDRKLLDERNLGMRDRAIEYLESGRTVFFAVGAAHMANDAGLVKLLADAGYTVEEFDY